VLEGPGSDTSRRTSQQPDRSPDRSHAHEYLEPSTGDSARHRREPPDTVRMKT
jgi:hypothetical protein